MGQWHPSVEDLGRRPFCARMNVLVTGNMGYVGPVVIRHLRETLADARLTGLDLGYFAHCLTSLDGLPERLLDCQYFADVRDVPAGALADVDAIVHLAAVSNDPIGKAFEEVTVAVNHHATVKLARRAREAGVRRFVFASSCSMYGFAEEGLRTEDSPLDPLTAYAHSKAAAERDLAELGDDDFMVTCLRFGTACGMSDRLRLDLVLNDFVAAAVADGRILILSDGTPWRPLIDIHDMARAIEWALSRDDTAGGPMLTVNVGADHWNYQVRELAEAVVDAVDGAELEIAAQAQPDRRSYRVSFEQFASLAPDYQPRFSLERTVRDLVNGLQRIGFTDAEFRTSALIRLNVLERLRRDGLVGNDLSWADPARATPIVA
jgi:nucleoside-diphosphate-sugar epimerase